MLFAAQAQGAGYAIKEQSGQALGNAFAGSTAGAGDISYMFFNPAALARQSGHQILAIGSYIAPRAKFSSSGSTNILSGGNTGGNGGNDIAQDALVPAFYGMLEVTPALKLGLGLNAPWGLVTEYDNDWVGRYHAQKSALSTLNINPAAAYRLNDWFSFGAGFQAQYIDAELTNAVDFGTFDVTNYANAFGGTPGADDGRSKITGDDWGFGYNLGVLIEPVAGTRIGVAYRSMIAHQLEGDADFDLGGAVGQGISGASGLFQDTGVTGSVKTPETVSFGFHQDIGAHFSIMGEAAWTHWSRFRELRFIFDNPAQADGVTDESWSNAWFFAGGVTYRPDGDWTLRAGVAHDQTPIKDNFRTPRIAGEDRTWIATGLGYKPTANLSIDIDYTHIFVKQPTLKLTTAGAGNTFKGNLSGRYDSAIDILSLQMKYRF